MSRRFPRWQALALLRGFALLLVGVAGPAAPARKAAAQPAQPPAPTGAGEARAGRELFQVACSSCHGLDGEGNERGPRLIGVGAASADVYLTTGRMPLDRTGVQAQRKDPAYTPRQIRQLVAYVASLGRGPDIPHVDPEKGNLVEGNELYANNCASCHSSAGAGGALGHSVFVPRLDQATPVQVAEAVRIGPGSMPRFGPDTINDEHLNSIVRYVMYLQEPEDRGGLGLGHLGPLPEGFVAWVVGLGLLVVAIRWIGTRD